MKKTTDFLKHAQECRSLAKQMENGAQRDQLQKMAETWEVLAEERERTLRNRPDDDRPPSGKPVS
ncbi:MAG TPA: hypothetical protein VFO36_06550 [Nitrospiraceae bacterium]|nr:hypothetical protein [Nitrospiraceae bacterium]